MEIVHENSQFYPPTRPSNPPISALDRFLTDQTHSLQLQPQSNDHMEVQMRSGFAEFSSPCGGFGDELYGLNPWLLPGLHSDHDYSGIFCDDRDFHGCINSSNTHEMMSECYNNGQEQPQNGSSSETKTSGRGRRRPSATSLGKRKWTEDEDRMLEKSVKKYGVKKWACISQELLDGRTAKQCRERWQNHLRPDIKKDSWSEEEEKVFIEAHEKLGNRWSEIARRIPGRTENAVKNHWNAAKRRRNQERGRKKKEGSDQSLPRPSSLLQDYMKRNNFNGVSTPHTKSSQDTNNDNGNQTISSANEAAPASIAATPISKDSALTPLEAREYKYSSPCLMTDTACDEEVMFMLNLFQAHHQPLGLQPPPMASWGGGYGEEPGDHLRHCHCHDHHHSSNDHFLSL